MKSAKTKARQSLTTVAPLTSYRLTLADKKEDRVYLFTSSSLPNIGYSQSKSKRKNTTTSNLDSFRSQKYINIQYGFYFK